MSLQTVFRTAMNQTKAKENLDEELIVICTINNDRKRGSRRTRAVAVSNGVVVGIGLRDDRTDSRRTTGDVDRVAKRGKLFF
jgi:hypothetical protein